MKNLIFLFALLISTVLISCSKGGPSQDVLIEELTNGSFIDGPKFNSNGTFSWDIDEGVEVSGKYKISKFYSSENERGYVGMRHLTWTINFFNQYSEFWDEDNSMYLSYDWNHPNSKKKLILEGESKHFPMKFEKNVDGNKLVETYWKDENTEDEMIESNEKAMETEVFPDAAFLPSSKVPVIPRKPLVATEEVEEEVTMVEKATETDKYFKIQDPDGYTNMRDAPGGSIIRRVLPNEKFKVSGLSGKYKVVKFDNGETGYIHNSRVVKY
jgi:hypothetical protein